MERQEGGVSTELFSKCSALLSCLHPTAMGWIDYELKPETLIENKSFFFFFWGFSSQVSLAVMELTL